MESNSSTRGAACIALAAVAVLLPPLAVFAPLGAAPLLVVAAAALLVFDRQRCLAGLAGIKSLAILLATLGLWGMVSSLWSILPEHSFLEGLRFLALSAGGLMILGAARSVTPSERSRIGKAMVAGIVVALLLLAIERFGNAPIVRHWLGIPFDQLLPFQRYDRGITVMVLALWPALFAVAPRWLRGLLLIAVPVMALLMESAAAVLSVFLGLVVLAVARFTSRGVAGVMIAGILAFGVAVPVLIPSYDNILTLHQSAPWIKWSGIHRLLIWRFSDDRIAEHPLLGWGMDASRAIPGGKTDFNDLLPTLTYPGGAESLPLHPHDAALQWQLELGLPGLALGLAILTWIVARLGWKTTLSRDHRAGALAFVSGALVVGLLSFGIWQAWWLSTLWLIASLFAVTAGDEAGA